VLIDAMNTIIVFILVFLMGTVSLSHAQPTVPVQDSLDAFANVQQWVRDWQMPSKDDPEIETIPVAAAIVTLRLDGRVFGRGSAVSLDPNATLVWQAAKEALASANAKLTAERDAMWDDFIADLSSRITITLEVADVLIPISKSAIDQPGFGYTPGVMGVVVRRGDQLEMLGPESMLARNTDMTQSAMALSNALAGDASAVLRSPAQLVESGYSFYRFEPIVLAQPGESMGASFIDRGGRVIDDSEISMRSISLLSENIAEHLIARQWAGVEQYGVMGTLDPVTGMAQSPFASPFDQAISAYALLRFGSLRDGESYHRATQAGRKILVDLSVVQDTEAMPWDDHVGSCMALIALSEIQLVDILGNEQLNALRMNCLVTLDGLYTQDDGFDESLPESSLGIVAHALVRSARLDPRDRTDAAHSAIASAFDSTSIGGLVGQMPFLGWAAIEQAGDGQPIDSRSALIQMRDLLWDHQLARADLAWMDRDLEGGIVFTSSSTPLPSWIGTKPLAMVSTMLGDARLTPGTASSGQVPIHIGNQFNAIRFIRQLCADTENLHMYASGESALWGVRRALWDQRMSVEADAMALLTLTETRRSFAAITARSKP